MKTCFIPGAILDPEVIYTESFGDANYIVFKAALYEKKYKIKESKEIKDIIRIIRENFWLYRNRDYVDLRQEVNKYLLDPEDEAADPGGKPNDSEGQSETTNS